MNFKHEKDKNKRSYEKPILRVIELSAEEVLGIGCKHASSSPAVGNAVGCIAIPCSASGS